jgi:hypothetical protein
MREQFRPYTIVATLAATDPSSIILTDSSGGSFKSNYISVEASGDGDDFFSVILSGMGNSAHPLDSGVDTKHAVDMLGFTSGVPGGTSVMNKGIVEFVLPDVDRVDSITITQSSTDVTKYFINYGQVWTGNPLRDQERPKGF